MEFREPLGPATKYFLKKLRTAYIVETAAIAERMASDNPHSYFLTPDGTCYHGRMISGGRKSDAGPLALKRELRQREVGNEPAGALGPRAARRTWRGLKKKSPRGRFAVASAMAQQLEAEKSLVAATHQRDEARREFLRVDRQLEAERDEIARLRAEAEAARARAAQARARHAEARAFACRRRRRNPRSRPRDWQICAATSRSCRSEWCMRREELATIAERLASSELVEGRL